MNIFPDQGAGGYPGLNLGNACGAGVYTNEQGIPTQLLSGCTNVAEDIPICQRLGKKILLSIGGASPDTYRINDPTSAVNFADFVWNAFGPMQPSYHGPRPFKDAVVDGFDFDIEHNGPTGYAAMISRLREHFKADGSGKPFYTSAAPQCILPDMQLSDAIKSAYFDFVWIQFFNTPGCSARDFITQKPSHFAFDDWVSSIRSGGNPNAKVFFGLPAGPTAVVNPTFYLNLVEVTEVVNAFQAKYPQEFGGVMLWEAAISQGNQLDGKSFGNHVKSILVGHGGGSGRADINATFNNPGTNQPSSVVKPTGPDPTACSQVTPGRNLTVIPSTKDGARVRYYQA